MNYFQREKKKERKGPQNAPKSGFKGQTQAAASIDHLLYPTSKYTVVAIHMKLFPLLCILSSGGEGRGAPRDLSTLLRGTRLTTTNLLPAVLLRNSRVKTEQTPPVPGTFLKVVANENTFVLLAQQRARNLVQTREGGRNMLK